MSLRNISRYKNWTFKSCAKCAVFLILIKSSLVYASVDFDPVTMDLTKIDSRSPPGFHEVFIPFAQGNLTGFILTANGKGPHPTFVLVHGLPGNEKNLDLAQSLRRAGFNLLFFHYQGAWGSEGDYSFSQLHNNVLSAVAFLQSNARRYKVDPENISLIGHSFGGYAVLRAATQTSELNCVIAISAANPSVIASSSRIDPTAKTGLGAYIDNQFMLNGFSGKQAVEELLVHQKVMDIRNYGPQLLEKKLLLIVGEQDQVTPAQLQQDVATNYRKIKGMQLDTHIIPGDHAFSISRIKLQRLVVDWTSSRCH